MEGKKSARQQGREFIYDYLSSHPCDIWSEADPVVLEFDHINENDGSVADLIADEASLERLQQEIDKCIVGCGNCHRRKSAKEGSWFRGGIWIAESKFLL